MKIWIDTNVLIDFIAERNEFVDDAQFIFSLCDGMVDGYISVLSFANMAYIFRKSANSDTLGFMKRELDSVFYVTDFLDEDINTAIGLNYTDFEDALQTAGAIKMGVDCIVTRDKTDFKNSPIPVVSPKELVNMVLS